jgi:hypothetical protein
MHTSAPTTQHPNQQQNSKAQGEPEQDLEEEIKEVIEDGLVCLHQKMITCD